MTGQFWSDVCLGVDHLFGYLGDNDLLAAMIFNDSIKMIDKMSISDNLFHLSKEDKEEESPAPFMKVYTESCRASSVNRRSGVFGEQALQSQPAKCACALM